MANKYEVVNSILKNEGEGTYNVAFTSLNIKSTESATQEEATEVIGALTDAIQEKLDLSYDSITGKPTLAAVATSGDYNDLENAPSIPNINGSRPTAFNPVAFTGVAELGDVQVTELLDLRDSSYSVDLQNLGSETKYIRGVPNGSQLNTFALKFQNNKGKKPFYIVSNAGLFLVLDVEIGLADGGVYTYYKFDVANVNTSTYNFAANNATTEELAGNILNSININSQLMSFVFDISNNIIYCKISDVIQDLNANNITGLAEVAKTGNYNNLINKPNLDASDSNTNITGLATIATSGSYDDLEDKVCIVNFSEFIYKYDSVNDNYTAMTGTEYNNIIRLGLDNIYIENIDKIYNSNDGNGITLKEAIVNLNNEFLNNKRCIFISNFQKKIEIENIVANQSGQTLNYLNIISKLEQIDRFEDLFNNNNLSHQEVFDGVFYTLNRSIFIFDLVHNVVYIKYQQNYPILSADPSIIAYTHNVIKVNISPKSGNQLQLITTPNEEGLYIGN